MARVGGSSVTTAGSSAHWSWTSVHDQYKTVEILGQGTYGVVYKAEHKTTGELVAMKRCRLDVFKEFGIPETTLREITLLRDLRHENIMTLFHISCNTERLYLVCEYLDLDLKKYIRSRPRGIPIRKVKEIAYELFKGLTFCHGHRVIHRDLKPHNVLVSSDLSKVKIADFGLARSSLAPGKTLTHEVITLWYRAPELLLGHCNYTSGVDIWSLGCIIAELLSSKPLYVGDSELDTLFKIFRLLGTPNKEDWPEHAVVSWADFPKFAGSSDPFDSLVAGGLDAEGKDLLSHIFKFNSNSRISALEALHHPWLAEIREAAIAAGEEVMKSEWMEWMEGQDNRSTIPASSDGVHLDDDDDEIESEIVSVREKDEIEETEERSIDDHPVVVGSHEPFEDLNNQVPVLTNQSSNNIEEQSNGHSKEENEKLNDAKKAEVVPQGKFQDVARMAQRMKELEEKLREVERQRLPSSMDDEINPQQLNQPQLMPPVRAVDPSSGVPTRATTATSSPIREKHESTRSNNEGDGGKALEEDELGRVPSELSAMRRHKFGVRRKTAEVDEVLVKERRRDFSLRDDRSKRPVVNNTSRWGMKGTREEKGGGGMTKGGPIMAGGASFMGRFIGRVFDPKKKKDQQQQRNEGRPKQKEAPPNRKRQTEPSQVGRYEPSQVGRYEPSQVGRYEPSQVGRYEQRHDNISVVDSLESDHTLESIRQSVNVPPPSRNIQPGRPSRIDGVSRRSLPPPPSAASTQQQQQQGWCNWNGRYYEEHQGNHSGMKSGDPYWQGGGYPYYQQHRMKHQQGFQHHRRFERMKEGPESLIRYNTGGRYRNESNNPKSTTSSSSRDLTSSLTSKNAHSNNIPNIPNNNSFWDRRDLSLDVECSFNWTAGQDDNTYRRPSFQPSTYQGMTFSSSDDRWKRSSSYGGSGVKESIARLNLKLAANASLVPSSGGRLPHSVSHRIIPNGSRHHHDLDLFGQIYEPTYFHDNENIRSNDSRLRSGLHSSRFNNGEDEYDQFFSGRCRLLELSGRSIDDPYGLRSFRRHTIEVTKR